MNLSMRTIECSPSLRQTKMDERQQFRGDPRMFSPALHFRSIWIIIPLLLLSRCVAARDSSEELPSPQPVYVDNSSLSWTPASQHNGVTNYTAQYRSFDSKSWKDVASCVETQLTSCDVSSTQEAAEYECVELRVKAQAHNLTSQPAEACKRLGDSCSPSVHLSAGSGYLSVQLNSSLREHAAYRVYYGLEGQPLQEYEKHEASNSSVTIRGLAEGQTYCAYVQFLLHNKTFGPPSCLQCVAESGDSCSPSQQLSAGPGYLSVRLNRSLWQHAAYMVYYGLEGQPVQEYNSTSSMMTISGLAEGKKYCAYVQCFLHNRKFGPPSCPNCVLIPTSGGILKLFGIISAVLVGVGLLVVMIIVWCVKKWRESPVQTLVDQFSNSGNENKYNTNIELDLMSKETSINPKEEQALMSKETSITQKEEQGLVSKETNIVTPKEEQGLMVRPGNQLGSRPVIPTDQSLNFPNFQR